MNDETRKARTKCRTGLFGSCLIDSPAGEEVAVKPWFCYPGVPSGHWQVVTGRYPGSVIAEDLLEFEDTPNENQTAP